MSNLDQSLTQLAEILQKIGVEELMISEDAHHHIINTDTGVGNKMIDLFCSRIQQLYIEVIG